MISVILDTNFLLIPAQFKVDIFSEIHMIAHRPIRLVVPDIVIEELEGIIRNQKGSHRRAAEMALQLIRTKGLARLKTQAFKTADDFILQKASTEAEKGKIWVATQDAALRKKLKDAGIPLVTLRGKSHLVIEHRGYM